jgi:hypothetical protein
MNLEQVLSRLEGVHRCGGYFVGRCPAHDDRNASLSIRETGSGKVLINCFAGCEYRAIIDALDRRPWRQGFDLPGGSPTPPPADNAKRVEIARRIWQDAKPAGGTTAERYLRLRGISLAPPPSIRFMIGRHAPSQTGPWAIMVAAVQNLAGEIAAIHRTFLTGDGRKAPVEPVKMALGPIRGCAVRFAKAGERLALAEGIETALAVAQACPDLAVWCALSASNLPLIELPATVREVIIAADGDEAGQQAAQVAALRFTGDGRKALITRTARGLDFNDYLRRERA